MVTVSPTVALWSELRVLAMPSCIPASSIRTTPEKAASLAKPVLSTVMPVSNHILRSGCQSNLGVRKPGPPLTAKVAAGCVADVIVSPSPVALPPSSPMRRLMKQRKKLNWLMSPSSCHTWLAKLNRSIQLPEKPCWPLAKMPRWLS